MRLVHGFLVVASAALFTISLSSHAITVTDGTTQNFSWSFFTPTDPSRELDGTGTLRISGFNSSALSITFTLTNNAAVSGQGGDRLTAFGFGIDPDATGASFVDAVDGGMVAAGMPRNTNMGDGIIIEVCTWGGNNCQGGSNGGLQVGQSDTFTLILTGNWGASVTIDPLAFKYQTGTGSYHFTGSSSSSSSSSSSGAGEGSTSSSSSGTTVPEPSSSLVLLGLGLLGLGYVRRLKQA